MLVVSFAIFVIDSSIAFAMRMVKPTAVQKVQAFSWRKLLAVHEVEKRRNQDRTLEKSALLYENDEDNDSASVTSPGRSSKA